MKPHHNITRIAEGYDRRIARVKRKQRIHEMSEPHFADRDMHSGGVWKMFDSSGNRLGTFDANLVRIGN